MHRSLKLGLSAATLVAVTAFATVHVVRGQDVADQAAMMAKMMQLASPGPEHAELTKLVGTWESTYKFRMAPEAPWMDSKGTTEITPLLGGRYIMQKVSGNMMGMPFEGISIVGYDKNKEQYISWWADSMSTWWVTSAGTEAEDGSVDYKGTMIDIAGERPFRMVCRDSADKMSFEMYDTIPPAGEVMVMTMESVRAGSEGDAAR